MIREATPSGSPWYRYFWPWFIVCLLGLSVVASLYTVSIAYRLGDLESPAPATGSFDESRVGSQPDRTTPPPTRVR